MQSIIPLKSDRSTVLMADAAKLAGRFGVWYSGSRAKRFPISGWNGRGDSLTWYLECPSSEALNVTALIKGQQAEVQLQARQKKLTKPISTNWNRVELGEITLSAGMNEVTILASQPGEGMEIYSLELATPELKTSLEKQAEEMRSNTAWMREARYGLQFHWTSKSQPRYGKQKRYADAVQDFDVDAFSQMVDETGAGYVLITTSHAEQYFPAPIKAIDSIMLGRTTERDLVRDLIEALGAYDIRLMLYYHIGHGHWKKPDGWWVRTGFDLDNPDVFINNWCSIMNEIGHRYGEGLAGWFYDDGCAYYPLNPDFRQLGMAAKAGNPHRAICYNPWIWPRFTDFQDYLCGEGYQFLKMHDYLPADGTGIFTDGPHKGLQAHTNFILEKSWCHSMSDTPIPPPQIPMEEFVQDMVSAIAHGIVPSVNLEIYQDGTCAEASIDYMRAVKRAIRAGSFP